MAPVTVASRLAGDPPRGLSRLMIEPPRPRAVRNSPKAPWLVVGTVCIGAFMGQLDASIVTLAFPTLRHSFSASLGGVQWVSQSYLLVLIGLLPAVGRYADMFGRKLLYTYGFALFVICSALCGLAPDLPALIAFRALQGVGAAMFQANSFAIIAGAMPRARLGRAIGIQGAAQAFGLALGPAAGGLLIGLGGWRLIFFVNVPVGLAGIVLALLLIPRSRDLATRRPFDWAGLGVFLPAVSAVLLAVSYGDRFGWGSTLIIGLFTAGGVLLALFVRRQHVTANPMIDMTLFRSRSFSAGICSGLLSYLVLFGALTVMPFFLEIARHERPAAAGAQLLVLPVGLAITAPFAGRLADRAGPRPFSVAGMITVSAALAVSTAVMNQPVIFLAVLAAAGVGLGAFTPANNAAIMGAAPPHQSGSAGGVLNMTRGLGTSLGLALAGLAFTVGAGTGDATARGAAAGYTDAAIFLAAAAAVAALICGLRRPQAPGRGRAPGRDCVRAVE
jgi:EmrB/QacA subfamily drug resistance transporter